MSEVWSVWFLIGTATSVEQLGSIFLTTTVAPAVATVVCMIFAWLKYGKPEYYRGVALETSLLPKVQVDIVVSKVPVRAVIETAKRVLYTGHIGDGKIFVYDVENVVKVRTGEEGYDALQDVE